MIALLCLAAAASNPLAVLARVMFLCACVVLTAAMFRLLWHRLKPIRRLPEFDPNHPRVEQLRQQLEALQNQLAGTQEQQLPLDLQLLERAAVIAAQCGEYAFGLFAAREVIAGRRDRSQTPSAAIHAVYAQCLSALHQWAEADTEFKTALELSQQQGLTIDPLFIRDYALNQGALGRWREELELYDFVDRLVKEQGFVPYFGTSMNRGVVYRQQGMLDRAVAEYDEAERRLRAARMPVDVSLVLNRGSILLCTGAARKALSAYLRAARLAGPDHPNAPLICCAISNAYRELGKIKEAHLACERADKICEQQQEYYLPQAAFLRAKLLFEAEQLTEAAHWMQAMEKRAQLRLEPLDHEELNYFAVVLRHADMGREALAKYDQLEQLCREREIDPEPRLAFNRALVYADLGQRDKALELLEGIKQVAQSNPEENPYFYEVYRSISIGRSVK